MTLMDLANVVAVYGEWFSRRKPVAKKDGALRFGILGAAGIAPTALILPARSHPEVIVAAVAARDVKKAGAYAKKYSIPIVHKSYDDLINDPTIDCIYNPLPNGLHYEWTLKCLRAGKHVLLEKPSTSDAEEAKSLFRHPTLKQKKLVLLEARHYQFHPAWHTYLSLIDAEKIEEANARGSLPARSFPMEDIRFNFDLAGGALMDLGTYMVSALRGVFQHEPYQYTSATARLVPKPFDQRCETAMEATYGFPNNGVGKIVVDLAGRVKYEKGKGGWWAWLFNGWPDLRTNFPPWVSVKMRAEHSVEGDNSVTEQKEITFHNFMGPHGGHRIETNTTITYRNAEGKVFDVKKQVETKKQYVWPEGTGGGVTGEDYWTTYRYQLEAFVDKVKGRKGSGVWLDGEDAIGQMEVIDKTYEKAGMATRPRRTELDRSWET